MIASGTTATAARAAGLLSLVHKSLTNDAKRRGPTVSSESASLTFETDPNKTAASAKITPTGF